MPQDTTRTIKMGEGDVVGIVTPVIPFNCIYDVDVGLVELVRNEFRDPDVFNLDLLDSFSDRRRLINYLYQREHFNPLISFMKNPEEEVAKDYYDQFMTKKYDRVLNYSVFTGLYDMISLFPDAEEVSGTIIYANDLEKKVLEEDLDNIKRKLHFIDIYELNDNAKIYNAYFVKSVDDKYFSLFMKFARSVTFYILDYKYNFNDDGELLDTKDTLAAQVAHCPINIINAYNIEKLGG